MADIFTPEDWVLIIDHLKKKNESIFAFKTSEPGFEWAGLLLNYEQIERSKESYFNGRGGLWEALDIGICPFLRYHIKRHKREYYCEIEHIKPITCAAFRCDVFGDDETENEKQYGELEKREKNLSEKRKNLKSEETGVKKSWQIKECHQHHNKGR